MTTKLPLILLAVAATVVGSACSSANERTPNTNSTTSNTVTTNNIATTNASAPNATSTTNTGAASHGEADGDVPAAVRAALADATTITKQHKDLSASQVSSIEKETNTKIADTDHHSYLGFTMNGGARRQTGAATVVGAGGKEMVIVYESRNGVPYIKEVRGESVSQSFLDQFKGKGHDDKLQVGQDVKAIGVDEATARRAADVIRQDTRIMQTLYGGAHSH
ncbi:MAG: hypothetical protein MSG64_18390 [Pyrinomonadaceae bacterium MAG19_C2-C3]|nr:hypothetical protein [Pyrinomonadaceae bacterium MAG19_C2-C3]